MVLLWFLLALVLLVAALVLLRLDARQRGGGSRDELPEAGQGPARLSGGAVEGDLADARGDVGGGGDDDDEDPRPTEPAETPEAVDESAGAASGPKLAPFQRASGAMPSGTSGGGVGRGDVTAGAAAGGAAARGGADTAAETDTEAAADAEALAAATASREPAAHEPASPDLGEPTAEPSPRLLDRVKALLPARRTNGRTAAPVEPEPLDPLAGSPVVRWLEDREFAPTPTPAPEFRHGDFAGGLSALGTVSHGVFRGRRAIMGVTGGRTVLALRRDTASDVVLDLSRPDVDAEPGFHDAGEVGALEARTSDVGRLDLIDRDRLAGAVEGIPGSVRRIWAEGEWVAATIDGVDDPAGWDDVVMALHAAADVVAPFPPIGGRARALPAEIDPGAPAAADGPDADPTMGMDGEVGTGTHGVAPLPDPEDLVVVDTPTPATSGPARGGDTATTATTSVIPAISADTPAPAVPGSAGKAGPSPKRAGHLRLVPDRPAARDLSDVPVVADRGDAPDSDAGAGDAPTTAPAPTPAVPGTTATPAPAGADTPAPAEAAEAAEPVESAEAAEPAEPVREEPDPFGEIMQQSTPVEARGDVAADHLEPRPPLSRPSRGVGQTYPEDATVPPLAAGAVTGAAGIKPLGSEDDADEIRDEVERFDAARIDGGSDFEQPSTGKHGVPTGGAAGSAAGRGGSGGRHGADETDPSEVTQRLSVAELAERMGIDPSEMKSAGRRRRRAAEDENAETPGRERPGIEPDVERTARIQLPPDIKD